MVGPYIVDFASRNPMLVIEIDRDTHGEQAAQDAHRTKNLEQQGYQVVRFSNAEVFENIEAVLGVIGSALLQACAPLPDPLP